VSRTRLRALCTGVFRGRDRGRRGERAGGRPPRGRFPCSPRSSATPTAMCAGAPPMRLGGSGRLPFPCWPRPSVGPIAMCAGTLPMRLGRSGRVPFLARRRRLEFRGAIQAGSKRASHALASLDLWPLSSTMTQISYAGNCFLLVIIQQRSGYDRFTLSFRDVEDLLRKVASWSPTRAFGAG